MKYKQFKTNHIQTSIKWEDHEEANDAPTKHEVNKNHETETSINKESHEEA